MNQTARILIVDDDEQSLELFEALLKAEHYIVVKARDGLDALDKFRKLQPDLVVLDLMMPRLNGYDVCAHLKCLNRNRHVPILVLTGLDDDEARGSALQSGADDFLPKPLAGSMLLERIRHLLASPARP